MFHNFYKIRLCLFLSNLLLSLIHRNVSHNQCKAWRIIIRKYTRTKLVGCRYNKGKCNTILHQALQLLCIPIDTHMLAFVAELWAVHCKYLVAPYGTWESCVQKPRIYCSSSADRRSYMYTCSPEQKTSVHVFMDVYTCVTYSTNIWVVFICSFLFSFFPSIYPSYHTYTHAHIHLHIHIHMHIHIINTHLHSYMYIFWGLIVMLLT